MYRFYYTYRYKMIEENNDVRLEYFINKFGEIHLLIDELYNNRIIFQYSLDDQSEYLHVETKLPKKHKMFMCSNIHTTLNYINNNLKILAIEHCKDIIDDKKVLVGLQYSRFNKISEQ